MKLLLVLSIASLVIAKEVLFKPRGRFFDKKFRLLLEDFYSKTDVVQQTQIDELLIGVSLANQTNGNSHNFYSTAFTNLKNIVPSLETINIDGGYVLKPAFGTADELRNEIVYLKEHMSSIIVAANEHNIRVPVLTIGVGYLFSTSIADQVDLYKLLSQNFNAEPIKDPLFYEFTMSFILSGVQCNLAVTISGIETPTIPKGRTPFITFSKLPNASMDTIARLYYNHIRISGRFDP